MTGAPELSVIVVAPIDYAGVRAVVRRVAAQTAAPRLELLLVATSAEALGPVPAEDAGRLTVRVIEAGPIPDVERALVPGIRSASAPVVALLEDHAFPEPDWAEHVIAAHRGPWAGVGPALLNANPASPLSWTNMLLAYGRWPAHGQPGETRDIARHNSSFRREVLLGYGERLEQLLWRSGGLLPALLADGHRLYFEPRARVSHVNPSRLRSTIELRFKAGRLYAGTRADQHRWPPLKRVLYVLGAPLIPPLRLLKQRRELLGSRRGWEAARMMPLVGLGVTLDALGQMVGYALGAGRAREELADFEVGRDRHITARDRRRLAAV